MEQPNLIPRTAAQAVLESSCRAQAKHITKTIAHFNLPQTEREKEMVLTPTRKPAVTTFQDSQQVYHLRHMNRELRLVKYCILGQTGFGLGLVLTILSMLVW
jgi:hypothetical protein